MANFPAIQIVLPLRTHLLLAAFVVALFGLAQISPAYIGGDSARQVSGVGWPALWRRTVSQPNWERGFNDWSRPVIRHELSPFGIAANLVFFGSFWFALGLAADAVSRKQFSLGRLFAIIFAAAVLLGQLVWAISGAYVIL